MVNPNLVELLCTKCQKADVPTLIRAAGGAELGHLGAWCSHCSHWITWVRQDSKWLALEKEQAATYASTSAVVVEKAIATSTWDEAFYVKAIDAMARKCWAQAESLGFHDGAHRGTLERAMLVVTELAELCEAARHNTLQSPSEHIPHHTQAAEEWADVLIRVFDHAWDDLVTGEELGRAFVAKLAFNLTRGYRHGGKTI